MQKPAYMISKQSVTVNFPGQTKTVLKTSSPDLFATIIKLIKEENWEEVKHQISIENFFNSSSEGHLVFKSGEIFHGFRLPDLFAQRIIDLCAEGLPFDNLVKFFSNLQKNPSKASRDQLFGFLEANHFPITDKGTFIAYKKVRENFTDTHTGTMDNNIGKTVSMPRDQVNPNPNETCSHGLHVAAYSYASTFGGEILLEVEVNPKDVVAVPTDYRQAKMRVCEYFVKGIADHGERKEQYMQSSISEEAMDDCGDQEYEDDLETNETSEEIEADVEDYGSEFNDW
jgi:hypothetical protein